MKSPPEAKPRKRPPVESRGALSHLLREILKRWMEKDDESPGLTVYEIALVADIDHKLLTRFLSGERGLTMISADRLAVAFGIGLKDQSTRAARLAAATKATARRARERKARAMGKVSHPS